jgi:hypothetical protein
MVWRVWQNENDKRVFFRSINNYKAQTMNKAVYYSRESIDLNSAVLGKDDLRGKVVVCFPFHRQLSEITIDHNIHCVNDDMDCLPDLISRRNYKDNCITPSMEKSNKETAITTTVAPTLSSKTHLTLSKSDIRKQSIELLSQCRSKRTKASSSLLLSTEKVDICFSKLFQKTDIGCYDSSPRMPTRLQTIVSLQKIAAA